MPSKEGALREHARQWKHKKMSNNRMEENRKMMNLTPYPSTGISYPEFILYVELISYFWAAIFDVMP